MELLAEMRCEYQFGIGPKAVADAVPRGYLVPARSTLTPEQVFIDRILRGFE